MNKLKEFFRSKAFYIAFGVGVLAFSGLLLIYNYSDNRQGLQREQAVDLNQPAEEEITEEEVAEELAPAESDGVLTDNDMQQRYDDGDYDEKIATQVTEAQETEEINDDMMVATDTEPQSKEEVEESVAVDVAEQISQIAEDTASGYSYDGTKSLAWPLNGDVILPYSMDTTVYYATLKTYKCNPGMLISGSEGTDIVSAYDGIVEAVIEDKEHGTMVRINHGNGYVTSYGQLMNVTVSEGEDVVLGQNIGELGPVTSYYTQEGTHLYFKMTKDDEPVNPIIYIQ